MIILKSVNDLLQVVTSAAGAIMVHVSYMDYLDGAVVSVPDRNNSALISTATTTSVMLSPAASTSRNLKFGSFRNNHATDDNVVKIQHTDGTNIEVIWKGVLSAGESVIIDANGHVTVYSSSGIPKTIQTSSVLSDQRAADYSGVAPTWTPTGTLGFAVDLVTHQQWTYYAGQWQ